MHATLTRWTLSCADTAPVQFLWVVECKHWSRRIEKLHVAALVEIVEDLGADRGLILSKEGFQSGAIPLAKNRNTSLTSLEDLRSDTADEYCEFQAGLPKSVARLHHH